VEDQKTKSLQQQLEEAEKRTAEAAKRREERAKRAQLERELRRAEATEVLDKLEELHGAEGVKLAKYVTHSGKLIVVVADKPLQMRKFRESKMTGDDCEKFVLPHVVHPTKEEFAEICDEEPACRDPLAVLLSQLYGLQRKEDEGK